MAACTSGITNAAKVVQLILRDPRTREDLVVLDVLPHAALGSAGFQGITLGENMSGLYRVPIDQPLKSAAYQEGATPSQYPRKKERRPKVTLHAQASTPEAYAQVETLLWTVLSVKWDCYLRSFEPDGTWRELKVRLLNEPDDQVRRYHGSITYSEWQCELLACDPFWYGPPYEKRFTRADMTAVNGGWEIDVPITNPTDQLGFIEWNSGELTTTETWSFQDGELTLDNGGPAMIPLPPLAPPVTAAFWVQTYPTEMQLFVRRSDGGEPSQQWARMRSRTFTKAIAANTPHERPIRARLVGGTPASEMLLTIPRRWDRPFGGELPLAAQMVSA
ncbi:hypothetical protein ACK8HH_17085 [Gordonia sp. LUNF6]|uniref:hypothetical protein n=1 Tax=unclassified Gordonia (in: high G+C Gram-positive bacteria) TaxID=2657482 RepID=UPI000783549C|nr:hypothetical protein [Gordonia sp. QH-12]KXT55657.1 hypothetical protein Y710_17995 [Gordonia sp. QH-12]